MKVNWEIGLGIDTGVPICLNSDSQEFGSIVDSIQWIQWFNFNDTTAKTTNLY